MRKLGTGVVVLVLIVAAAYGFYWYQVKSKADELAQQMAPFAEVRYGSVYAHPDGTVGVDDLVITPRQMHAPVSMDAVRIRAGGPLSFCLAVTLRPSSSISALGRCDRGWTRNCSVRCSNSLI